MTTFRPLYYLLLACALLFCGSAIVHAQQAAVFHNQPVYDFRPGNPDLGSGPAFPAGAMAPDFAIPEIYSLLQSDEQSINKIRLSSFRGKRPVVLIGTGYT